MINKTPTIGSRDVNYDGYTGASRFLVEHSKHGGVTVGAPDADTAIVAAAKYWKRDWTRYSFYKDCSVSKI